MIHLDKQSISISVFLVDLELVKTQNSHKTYHIIHIIIVIMIISVWFSFYA